MTERLKRITTRAKDNPVASFNNVFTLLNQELLFLAFRQLKRDKAPGFDGVTVDDCAVKLQANLRDLENRLHAGSYRFNWCHPFHAGSLAGLGSDYSPKAA